VAARAAGGHGRRRRGFRPPPRTRSTVAEELAADLYLLFLAMRPQSWTALESAGLTPTQGAILTVVSGSDRPLNITSIANRLKCSRPTVSRSVANLEQKGYVVRSRTHRDRRSVFIEMGRPGHRCAEWSRTWGHPFLTAVGGLSKTDGRRFRRLVAALLDELRRVDLADRRAKWASFFSGGTATAEECGALISFLRGAAGLDTGRSDDHRFSQPLLPSSVRGGDP